MRPSSPLPASLIVLASAAACQPTLVDVEYNKDAPLYGSDDDPGGSTGAGSDDGGGGAVDPDDPIVGEFLMAHESDGGFVGAVSCEAWWNVTGEPASTECPDCGFTIDWAYEMTYALDTATASLPPGCEFTTPGYIASSGSYGEQILSMYLGTWAFSGDYGSGGELLMGYSYYGYQDWRAMPGAEVVVTDNALEWHYVDSFTYDGYGYGYYDEYTVTQTWAGYASGQ